MHDTTQKFTPQTHTVFGDFYVREQHNEAADHHLPPPDMDQVIKSLRVSMFREVMKSLRSTLGMRRQPEHDHLVGAGEQRSRNIQP